MNRSFLIILLPAIAVGLGYILLFRRLGIAIEPFRFAGAALVVIVALILVHRHQKRRVSRRGQS